MSRRLRLFSVIVLAIVLCAAGCSRSPEQTPPAQTPQANATLPAHMSDHFGKVREVEEAIIRGDVEAARTPARWIADHQELTGLPGGTEQHVKEMKATAASMVATDNVETAAIMAATLVGSCGDCHTAAKISPKLPQVTAVAQASDRRRHMLEHQHAIDRMYRGLVGPSTEEWQAGAAALKAAPLGGHGLPEVSKEALAAETRVHELATNALGTADQSGRVTIYGAIIGACAKCHGLHGRVWGPGLQKTN